MYAYIFEYVEYATNFIGMYNMYHSQLLLLSLAAVAVRHRVYSGTFFTTSAGRFIGDITKCVFFARFQRPSARCPRTSALVTVESVIIR